MVGLPSRLDFRLPETPTTPVLHIPTTAQEPYASAEAQRAPLLGPTLNVPITLYDRQSDPAFEVLLWYALDGAQWTPATIGEAGTPLAASPSGTDHTLTWQINNDLDTGSNESRWVRLRLEVPYQRPQLVGGPTQVGRLTSMSPPFRLKGCDPLDSDGDGLDCYSDCDDNDVHTNSGLIESCDGQDNDCDEATWAGADSTWEADQDGDGYLLCGIINSAPFVDRSTGFVGGDDCDDGDGLAYPGATESCDSVDSDCDGSLVDEFDDFDGDGTPDCADDDDDDDGDPDASDCAPFDSSIYSGAVTEASATECMLDSDGDGFGDDSAGAPYDVGTDCNDSASAIYPGATEYCNATDSDCDGSIVEDFDDTDSDGEPDCIDDDDDGDGDLDETDCNDTDPAIYNGATEVPGDGVDSNCNGDNGQLCYTDADDDTYGYGDAILDDDGLTGCPSGQVLDNTDCWDGVGGGYAHPNRAEVCDGIDNDCSSGSVVSPSGSSETDDDGDLYVECSPWTGHGNDAVSENDAVLGGGDCDDNNQTIHPGATKVPDDGLDNDCSGVDASYCYLDQDQDGYGKPTSKRLNPDGPAGCPSDEVAVADDCDDNCSRTYPGAEEVCDGMDNNCDEDVPPDELDNDGDNYIVCELHDSLKPQGGDDDDSGSGDNPDLCLEDVNLLGGGDCDDTCSTESQGDDALPCEGFSISPIEIEVCGDGADNDCDGTTDETADVDGDGVQGCLDCDDEDEGAYPGAAEDCSDEVDQDCDGSEAAVGADPDCWEASGCACSVHRVAAVPPSVLWLLGAVFGGLGVRRRRKVGFA